MTEKFSDTDPVGSGQQRIAPADDPAADPQESEFTPTVGSDDAAADAARSGADVPLEGAAREGEGEPAGTEERAADIRSSGGDSEKL